MATIKKYNGSTWENTTARKYETKSETITPPTTIYTDGTAITAYTIKGNTVQNGTPTPSNPVEVNGVGVRAENLSGERIEGVYISSGGVIKSQPLYDVAIIPVIAGGVTTTIYLGSAQTVRQIKKLVFTGEENWQKSSDYTYYIGINDYLHTRAVTSMSTHYLGQNNVATGDPIGEGNCCFYYAEGANVFYLKNTTPYSTLQDFKLFLAAQYANGTPVTVWYVLATPETAAVNEPLMKIGDYADTLSNATAIPTTEGANSITVDTTVQPSEFTATWTGWHNASVKEWDGSDWQYE